MNTQNITQFENGSGAVFEQQIWPIERVMERSQWDYRKAWKQKLLVPKFTHGQAWVFRSGYGTLNDAYWVQISCIADGLMWTSNGPYDYNFILPRVKLQHSRTKIMLQNWQFACSLSVEYIVVNEI